MRVSIKFRNNTRIAPSYHCTTANNQLEKSKLGQKLVSRNICQLARDVSLKDTGMLYRASGGTRISNLGGQLWGEGLDWRGAMQKFYAIRVSVLFDAICVLFINIGFCMFSKLIFFAIELFFLNKCYR